MIKIICLALSLGALGASNVWAQAPIVLEEGNEVTSFSGTSIRPLSSRDMQKKTYRSIEDLKTEKKVGAGLGISGLGQLVGLVEVNLQSQQAIQIAVGGFDTSQSFGANYRYTFLESKGFEIYSLAGASWLSVKGKSPQLLPQDRWLSSSEQARDEYELLLGQASLGISKVFLDVDVPGLGVFGEIGVSNPVLRALRPHVAAQFGTIFYF